ncbi:serine hydrolase [Streptomyces sp. ALB3]|uniref:serine hydrolase n=1 Tax=Streptomyces sp. ALB3 TaxID=3374278 RepID=UPI0037AB9FC4
MVEDRIREVFAGAGAEGLLHALPLGRGPDCEEVALSTRSAGDERDDGECAAADEVAVGADQPVVIASIFKVLLVLEFARQVAAGQLDPRERVRVTAADRLGGWGTAGCADDVELSLRDLAHFALTVSDNSAADLLLAQVGLDTVRLLVQELRLERTRIVGGPRDVLQSMLTEVGARDEAEFALRYPALPDERKRRMSVLDPSRTNASTPREITRLLGLVWRDEAGPPQACAHVRGLMSRQVFRHRLVSGFPDEVTVSAKTGTLPGLHMEAGVVRYPDGSRYAVSVFARTRELATSRPAVDAAIGATARLAVEFLRSRGS